MAETLARSVRSARISRSREGKISRLHASSQASPTWAEAEKYVSAEKDVPDAEAALAGARDILAESVSDDAALRKVLRELLLREGMVETKAAKEEDSVYAMYYDYREPGRTKSFFTSVWAFSSGASSDTFRYSSRSPRLTARIRWAAMRGTGSL